MILIITIIVILFTYLIQRHEYFTDEHMIDINKITFSKVPLKITERDKITSFPLPIPLESKIEHPLKNNDPQVKKELEFIHELTTNQQTPEKMAYALKIEQKGVLNEFIDYCGKFGLIYDDKHLTKLSYDLTTYCTKVQYIYNRPRPSQLAFIHQININPLSVSKTPSYPACQTFKAKVLAYVIGYNNPTKTEQLHALAKKIELSRLYGGYNFPSDNIAALVMADIFHKYVKHLET